MVLEEGRQTAASPGREFPETGAVGMNRPREMAHPHLIGVAGINQQGIRIIHQLVPFCRRHIDANSLLRQDIGTTQADDLVLDTHFEMAKGRGRR